MRVMRAIKCKGIGPTSIWRGPSDRLTVHCVWCTQSVCECIMCGLGIVHRHGNRRHRQGNSFNHASSGLGSCVRQVLQLIHTKYVSFCLWAVFWRTSFLPAGGGLSGMITKHGTIQRKHDPMGCSSSAAACDIWDAPSRWRDGIAALLIVPGKNGVVWPHTEVI